MKESGMPAWLEDAHWYYSQIGEGSADPVSVFLVDGEELSDESSGTLCLRLVPRHRRSPRVTVLDADGCEQGLIRPDGLVAGLRYAMRRGGGLVWSLSVRSLVRKHYVLEWSRGASWAFDTPFYWWQGLTGTALGAPRVLGCIGPFAWIWLIWIEPGWDSLDVLAAVAFLHRQWFHW
jgi:hypothetical protein